MKVLVSGISGFLGSGLVRYFSSAQDVEVYGLSSSHQGADYRGVKMIYSYDELNSYNEFDVIIHLAGIAHDISGKFTDDDYTKANFHLTQKVFDKFLQSTAKKFVFASTSKVYGDVVCFAEEDADLKPLTIYAQSKIESEEWLLNHKSDRDVYILRPAMVHGWGNKGNLNVLFQLLSKIPFNPFGFINNSRSSLSLDNFNFIIKKIMTGDLPPGIYNAADAEPFSLAKVTSLLTDKTSLFLPQFCFRLLAMIGDFIQLSFFNNKVYSKLMETSTLSTNKLIKEGVTLPLSTEEGILITKDFLINAPHQHGMLEIPDNFSCDVSIITPVYDSALYLDEMIQSVFNQTYKDFELILVDDCSNDHSVQIIQAYQKKYSNIYLIKNQKNIGPGLSRNKAIKLAKGRFIAFLDSDDVWAKEKLEFQISLMKEKNLPFTHTSYAYIDHKSVLKTNYFKVSEQPVTYRKLLKKTEISCLTAIYDVSVIGKQYMPDLRLAEDYSLWLQILKKGFSSYPISKVLAYYRIREGSITSNKFSLIYRHWEFLHRIHGLNFFSSLYYMLCWAYNGVKKYY